MINVLIVSNNIEKDVKKIENIIKDICKQFFIDANIIIKEADEEISSLNYDFAITFDNNLILDIKTIDATPIIIDILGEKVEKDIQSQLLKAKATHIRESRTRRA